MYSGPERRHTHEEVKDIINEAVKESSKELFAMLGVDVDNPKEVEEFRKDLRFGGTLRKAAEKGFLAAVVVITGTLITAMFLGIKVKILGG